MTGAAMSSAVSTPAEHVLASSTQHPSQPRLATFSHPQRSLWASVESTQSLILRHAFSNQQGVRDVKAVL
jgi:hypothetical protein